MCYTFTHVFLRPYDPRVTHLRFYGRDHRARRCDDKVIVTTDLFRRLKVKRQRRVLKRAFRASREGVFREMDCAPFPLGTF